MANNKFTELTSIPKDVNNQSVVQIETIYVSVGTEKPTIEELIDFVKEKTKDKTNLSQIKFKFEKNGKTKYRYLSTDTIKSVKLLKEQLDDFSENQKNIATDFGIFKEYDKEKEPYNLATNWVLISTLEPRGRKRTKEKFINVGKYNLYTPASEDGDCLRQALSYNKKELEKLDNDTGSVKDFLNYSKNIIVNLFELNVEIKREFYKGFNKNSKDFINLTKVRTNKIYELRNLVNKKELKENDLILYKGHYWIFMGYNDFKDCYISGLSISKRSKLAKVDDIVRYFLKEKILEGVHPNYSVKEMRNLAKSKKIKGYSRMNKTKLMEVLNIKQTKITKKKSNNIRHFAFDFETVQNIISGENHAISAAVDIVDFEIINNTLKIKKKIAQEFICGSKTGEQLLKLFAKYKCDGRNIITGFNNSRFDNFVLLKEMIKLSAIKNGGRVFIAGNSLLEIGLAGFETMDLCRFINCSLKKACEDYGTVILKGSFDFKLLQDPYERFINQGMDNDEAINSVLKVINIEKLKKYNIADCTTLTELVVKLYNSFYKMCEIDFFKCCTIGQLSMKAFKNTLTKDKISSIDYKDYEFIRSSMYGGRVQIMQKGMKNEEYISLDIKSLYPFIMMTCLFPYGEYKHVDKYVDGKLGIYNVIIHEQNKLNIIPNRTEDKPLNWSFKGEIKCSLTSVDIECLKLHKSKITILDGIYWEKSCYIFKDFIEKSKKIKDEQDFIKRKIENGDNSLKYNGALRNVCKLFLNALSGKVGQRLFLEENKLLFTTKGLNDFRKNHSNITWKAISDKQIYAFIMKGDKPKPNLSKRMYMPYLSAFIYSYARSYMYTNILYPMRDCCLGTDTDSAHVLKSEAYRLKHLMGNEFGDLENEINFTVNRSYHVRPKCYAFFGFKYDDNGNKIPASKMRFKSVGKNSRLLNISVSEFEKMDNSEKRKVFNNSPLALSEQLYKDLCDGKEVNTICLQFRKNIRNLSIDTEYIIKKFTN